MADDPLLRQKLCRIAELHGGIAKRLKTVSRPAARTAPVSEQEKDYELELIGDRGGRLTLAFRGTSDIDAVRVAHALQEACSEFYSNFKLSQATRRVAVSSPRRPDGRRSLHLMGERALKELLDLEDFLTGSGLPVAESRTLLQHQQQLRWRLRLLGSSEL
jgi:hypothetical protein